MTVLRGKVRRQADLNRHRQAPFVGRRRAHAPPCRVPPLPRTWCQVPRNSPLVSGEREMSGSVRQRLTKEVIDAHRIFMELA